MSLLDWMNVDYEEVRKRERKLTEEKLRTGRVRNKCCDNCEHLEPWEEDGEEFPYCMKFGEEISEKEITQNRQCWAWEMSKICLCGIEHPYRFK